MTKRKSEIPLTKKFPPSLIEYEPPSCPRVSSYRTIGVLRQSLSAGKAEDERRAMLLCHSMCLVLNNKPFEKLTLSKAAHDSLPHCLCCWIAGGEKKIVELGCTGNSLNKQS